MMRHTWGVLWGLAAGAFLSVIWLALAWIWRHFGRDLVSWIVNNPSTGESGIGLFELVPPALGCDVYGFGLEWLGRRISANRVSRKSFSWRAAAICSAFPLALADLMFFVAYSAPGASSFLMLIYGISVVIFPILMGCVYAGDSECQSG